MGTDRTSGIRSSTGRGPVLAPPASSGPASSALPQLAQQLGNDDRILNRFVSDYLGLLDHRMRTLRQMLHTDEPPDDVRVCILSLETTSAMLGATDVVGAARALRAAASAEDRATTEQLYDRLLEAVETLRQLLVGQGFTSSPPPPAAGGSPADSPPHAPSPRSEAS